MSLCYLHVPFDPHLKRKLKAIAAKQDRSLTSLIAHTMRELAEGRRDVEAPGPPGEDITDATYEAIKAAASIRRRYRRLPD